MIWYDPHIPERLTINGVSRETIPDIPDCRIYRFHKPMLETDKSLASLRAIPGVQRITVYTAFELRVIIYPNADWFKGVIEQKIFYILIAHDKQ